MPVSIWREGKKKKKNGVSAPLPAGLGTTTRMAESPDVVLMRKDAVLPPPSDPPPVVEDRGGSPGSGMDNSSSLSSISFSDEPDSKTPSPRRRGVKVDVGASSGVGSGGVGGSSGSVTFGVRADAHDMGSCLR